MVGRVQVSLQIQSESFFKLLERLFFEAREAGEVHQLNQVAEDWVVLPYRNIGLHSLGYIQLVGLSLLIPTNNVNELLGELEVG